MIRFDEKTLFTSAMFAFVALIFSLTLGLGRVARLVPMVVVIPTLGLLLFQLLIDMFPRVAEKFSRFEKKDVFRVEPLREKSHNEAGAEQGEEGSRRSQEMIAFLWLSSMLALIYLFGFLIALPVYIFLYLRKRSDEGWLMSAAIAAGMFSLIYGVFILTLGIRLYEGNLWKWLGL